MLPEKARMITRVAASLALMGILCLAACSGPALSPGGLVEGGRSYTQPPSGSTNANSYNWLEGGGG